MAHMLLPSLGSYPFDKIKFSPEGLTLSRCSCAGTAKYFIPRAHIDHVQAGRQLFIKTLLIGAGLLAWGVYSETQGADARTQLTQAALYIGGIIVFIALVCMLPSTLTISSNAGSFHSTNCSNTFDVEAVLAWLKAGNTGGSTTDLFAGQNGAGGGSQQQLQRPMLRQMSMRSLNDGGAQYSGPQHRSRQSGGGYEVGMAPATPTAATAGSWNSPSPSAPPMLVHQGSQQQLQMASAPPPAPAPANGSRVTLRPLRASGTNQLGSPSMMRQRSQLSLPEEGGDQQPSAPPQMTLPEQAVQQNGGEPQWREG